MNLKTITYLYINSASLFFSWCWLASPWKYLCSLAVIVLSVVQLSRISMVQVKLGSVDLLKIAFWACIFTLLAGVSGIGGASTFDIRHQLQKVFDIQSLGMPIYYPGEGYASYYFGFYIVPGILLYWIKNVSLVVLFWEILGLSIGLSWLYLAFNKRVLGLVLLFLVSGLLSFLVPLWNGESILSSSFFYFTETQWHILPMFQSYKWVPNQFIYVLILVGLVLNLRQGKLIHISSLVVSGLFWAPFSTLIIGLIYLAVIFKQRSEISFEKKDLIIFLGCNSIVAFFLLLYLAGNNTSGSVEFLLSDFGRLRMYVLLVFFEVIVFYLLIGQQYKYRVELMVSLGILLVLPLIKMGVGNDLFSRSTLPVLMIVYIYFIKSLLDRGKHFYVRLCLLGLVSILPLKYLSYGVINFSTKPYYSPTNEKNTYTLIEEDYQSKKVAGQYLLREDSFFYKHLLSKESKKPLD